MRIEGGHKRGSTIPAGGKQGSCPNLRAWLKLWIGTDRIPGTALRLLRGEHTYLVQIFCPVAVDVFRGALVGGLELL